MEGVPDGSKPGAVEVEHGEKEQAISLAKIMVVASIATGINFGWALQFTLLTPYLEILGTPHMWVSFVWLCAPVTGIFVQPMVGYYSDRCTSRFGRRRPFIAAGVLSATVAVFLIAFSADLGHLLGDKVGAKLRPRTIAVLILGFAIIDFANNVLQGPCRAILADLAAGEHRKTRTAYAFYSFFSAMGNILGSAAGAAGNIHRVLPFTKTKACDDNCANIKTCFFMSITLLLTLATVAMTCAKEKREKKKKKRKGGSGLRELLGAWRGLKKEMWILLLVTGFNWIAWFPWEEYNTDWMGKEVYGGKQENGKAYLTGVHAGALGLLLNSAVAGATALGVEYLARALGGVKTMWGIVNFLLAATLAITVLISHLARRSRRFTSDLHPLPPSPAIKAAALTLFSVLGIPYAVSYTVPFSLASMFSATSGAGQGLSLGILNIAIAIPQILVSLASGPWDNLFGDSNLPSFLAGAVAAAISGILSITLLPSPPPDLTKTVAGGFH